jgi:hypothetical protein
MMRPAPEMRKSICTTLSDGMLFALRALFVSVAMYGNAAMRAIKVPPKRLR